MADLTRYWSWALLTYVCQSSGRRNKKKKKDGEWEMTEKKKKGPFGTNNRNICWSNKNLYTYQKLLPNTQDPAVSLAALTNILLCSSNRSYKQREVTGTQGPNSSGGTTCRCFQGNWRWSSARHNTGSEQCIEEKDVALPPRTETQVLSFVLLFWLV